MEKKELLRSLIPARLIERFGCCDQRFDNPSLANDPVAAIFAGLRANVDSLPARTDLGTG
jgi:hypothetical protein